VLLTDLLYLERLSDADLAVLAGAAGVAGATAAELRAEPGRLEELLADPAAFETLLEGGRDDPLVVAGPFLAFAVLLAHVPALLEGLTFVPDYAGRGRRVPVFEVEPLREFAAAPLRRLFLADLLASYTHVASGAVWVKSGARWRSRRFSELDPSQVAELILTVPPDQRLALHRRLGDLALFLSGIFPDAAGTRTFSPVALERLRRAVAEGAGAPRFDELRPTPLHSLQFLEWLGMRSYRLAWEASAYREAGFTPVLEDLAEHFRYARMILNLLTDSYLFRHRERWFPWAS
jgi:hypothetical protein